MFKSIVNLFFPKVCSGCNSFLLTNENVICTVCRHDIPLTNHHLSPDNDASKKFYGRVPILHASALFYFHKNPSFCFSKTRETVAFPDIGRVFRFPSVRYEFIIQDFFFIVNAFQSHISPCLFHVAEIQISFPCYSPIKIPGDFLIPEIFSHCSDMERFLILFQQVRFSSRLFFRGREFF